MSLDFQKVEGKLTNLLDTSELSRTGLVEFLVNIHPDLLEKAEGFVESNDWTSSFDGKHYIVLNHILYDIEYEATYVETYKIAIDYGKKESIGFSAVYCLNDDSLVDVLEEEI